jgi:hypothetical protein
MKSVLTSSKIEVSTDFIEVSIDSIEVCTDFTEVSPISLKSVLTLLSLVLALLRSAGT